MNKHQLINLLEKYAAKKANSREKQAVDIFFKKVQEQEDYPLANLNQEKGNKIFQRIEDKIKLREVTTKKYWRRVMASAAVLVLLVSSVFLSLILDNTITQIAVKGEKKHIELNDGSKIFLNSGSKISYTENFKENRKLTLEGEAFFEVAPNPDKPFIIKSGHIETKVLGTSFNINAYNDGNEIVSVNSGIVEVVNQNNPSQKIMLTKNIQLNFKLGNDFQLLKEKSENYNAWNKNTIVLKNTSLGETARILENWFDVNIEFKNPKVKKLVISGKFKEEKLETILKSIALIKDLKFEYKTPKHIIIREQEDIKN